MVLDEGHQIKNSLAEVSRACREVCLPETRRVLLTGTPILNNLKELWSLFDFATDGKVLGNSKQFTQYFANHIEAARDRLAPQGVIQLGQRKNTELREKIRPYFLQRLKIDFLKDKLPPKTDIVVWTHLADEQRRQYTDYVESSGSIVRSILSGTTKSPLEGITWLKKLCGHPELVSEKAGDRMKSRHGSDRREDVLLRQSAKLQVLLELMQNLKNNSHRVLIFSQSTKMLDMITLVLKGKFKLSRIDGSTPGKDRQGIVDMFNKEEGAPYDVMLLSTKAAGCGLTLTGADTAIVYDPSWTPAEDSQAVDRCYRIGQTKPVTVYRLIAAGTVEEKTYEKQIHKDGLRRTVFSEDQQVERYFQRDELRDLFKLGEPGECRVMNTLEGSTSTIDRNRHAFVEKLSGVVGITRHDGFYDSKTGNEKAAFDRTMSPRRPTTLGRSQRVLLARSMSPDVETIDQANRRKQNHKVPSKPKEHPVEQIPSHSDTIHSRSALETDSEMISKMMDSSDHHMSNGHYRKCLEVLVDMVESGTLMGKQKLEVHKKIAAVAYMLHLL